MKHLYLCLLAGYLSLHVLAGEPVVRVDFNLSGRPKSEVNEPGYTPWVVPARQNSKAVFSGIGVELKAIGSDRATLETGWSKMQVQSPYLARLANDGISVAGKGILEMRIKGLPPGQHSLQTFHNSWNSPSRSSQGLISVYLNGKAVHEKVESTCRVEANCQATILFTKLEVENKNQEMVLQFIAEDGGGICLDGFEINTPDRSKQARLPCPSDGFLHADADKGSLSLNWKKAPDKKIIKQLLYFGSDSAAVAAIECGNTEQTAAVLAEADCSWLAQDLYCLQRYYWRVDQQEENGDITRGDVWSFQPRRLAFRGAEGYGRYATGGRGGKVVVVSNLNDDGPGSFREAVSRDIGPRTIVFNVSGIIMLKSRLSQGNSHITIAGQTAPGKGICIRSAPFGVGSESICRFMRFRLGSGATGDGLGMAGANHSIVDHCSVSWTSDEAFSSRNAQNITLQRTLISEALNLADHKNYPPGTGHGYAATIGGNVGSFHHNLLAHCYGRNWSLGGGLDGSGHYAGKLDIFNNVVYNWSVRATDGGAHQVNFVNNYYKTGPSTTQFNMLHAQLEGVGAGTQSYYYDGNVMVDQSGKTLCDGSDNTCGRLYTLYNRQILNWEVFVDTAFFPSFAKIQEATLAYKSVLSDVGCNLPLTDQHDQRILRETLNGSYTYSGSSKRVAIDAEFPELSSKDPTKNKGIIDHEKDAGGYEDYPEIRRPDDFDSDNDGLPDWWEKLHGSNPHSPSGDFGDSNADPDKDGYTVLEDYLEWMSVPQIILDQNQSLTMDLSEFCFGFNNNPVFKAEGATQAEVQINGTRARIKAKNKTNGISYFNLKVIDDDGYSMQRTIGLYIK
ncbi:MAG: thrombospondin type 3 repeat-containing protein [Bacteroidales bacterium]|nr:thrombospondin type 3 repeat-containing protein [Bacteroidales bacterium]MDD4360831.1 thrombospondin type 3 repeat-containing protein [Bacteroidales bacterium]MDD4430536.1 thrombospondin type 3 repeat-containing protein [Bacteroidales bacterium]